MHGRHMKKAPKFLAVRGLLVFVLVLALTVSSFVTVMANTVSVNVIDGDESYSFSMGSTDLSEILVQAERQGLEPLGALDVAERVGTTTTVNIRRGVHLTITEAGETSVVVAYKGDTLQKALEENSILLKDGDQVAPSRETVLESGLQVEISRVCGVTVTADGKTAKLSLVGGTVADALKEAGIKLGAKDSLNYDKGEALFDKMNIRVSRVMKIKITADGETKEYETAARTVDEAIKKCGIELSEDDRLNVKPKDKLTDGMSIEIKRVEIKEVKEKAEVDYTTSYESSSDMYEDETSVITAGVKGEAEVTYKVTYVEGREESREEVSKEVVKEPVPEVVLKGTKERPVEPAPDYSSGNGTGNVAGTFTDMYGNTVSYSNKMVGECTAYSVPGGTTSIGMDAVYGVIAVDPNIIPYGTRMYVTSPDGSVVYGYGVAGDTGGACMAGDIIADLCYNTIAECSIIGRRDMIVYILS